MMRLILPLAVLAATPALAHHPMGAEAPQTAFHGLLSGLGHPVIGIDHLAFIVLVGLAAAGSGRLLAAPLAFIFATLAGTLGQLAGLELPLPEIVVAGSVALLGALLFLGRRVSGNPALGGFAFAGLFHGWAYGEAVIGSETGVVAAYLLGFGAMQFAISAGTARLARKAVAGGVPLLKARLAAALCCGIGLAFLVEEAERLVLG